MVNVEEKIFLARVAEQAERFEDMVDFLDQVLVVKGGAVNSDERNLLSVAFKNLISGKRAACRTISAIEQNPKYAQFSGALAHYKLTIENQLTEDCERIINIIKTEEDTATNVVIGSGSCTCQECCTGIHPLSDLADKVQAPHVHTSKV